MDKMSVDTQLQAIHEYLTGHDSTRAISQWYGIGRYHLLVLVAIYNLHGEQGLTNPPKITGEFRLNLVKWKQNHRVSLKDACAHFDFASPSSLSHWERKFRTGGKAALLAMDQRGNHYEKRKPTRSNQTLGTRELILADTERRLKKITSLEKATKKQLAEVIISLRAKYRLVDMIRALPISMSTFQYWQHKLIQADPDQSLLACIRNIFETHRGHYGVKRVTPLVRKQYATQGKPMPNHKRIQRIMHEHGLKCQVYTKRTRKYDSSKGPRGRAAKNQLRRRNMTDRPFQKLVSDVTEMKAKNGDKVYLEPIKDLYSNRVLEWEIANHPTLDFCLAPLERLLAKLPHTGYQVTLHTDQGWQYCHEYWRHVLKKNHIRQSMSRRSTCLDNAACETLFNKLKAEIGPGRNYATGTILKQAISDWLDYYNNDRIQNKLNDLSPVVFEQQTVKL